MILVNIFTKIEAWRKAGGDTKWQIIKKMYLTAMDAMEKAIALLEEAQQKCEDIYIETDETEEEPTDLEDSSV